MSLANGPESPVYWRRLGGFSPTGGSFVGVLIIYSDPTHTTHNVSCGNTERTWRRVELECVSGLMHGLAIEWRIRRQQTSAQGGVIGTRLGP